MKRTKSYLSLILMSSLLVLPFTGDAMARVFVGLGGVVVGAPAYYATPYYPPYPYYAYAPPPAYTYAPPAYAPPPPGYVYAPAPQPQPVAYPAAYPAPAYR